MTATQKTGLDANPLKAPLVRVQFLQSVASENFVGRPGDKASISVELAKAWEASGTSVIIESEKKWPVALQLI
jgi:hypothetical protein